MSHPAADHSNESGSFWNIANLVIGACIALFAGFWGVSFIWGGMEAAQRIRAPKPVEVSAPQPEAAAPTPATAATAAAAAAAAVPAGPAQELVLGPDAVNPMAFNKKTFTVKAGQPVKLTFSNSGGAAPLPHNVIVGKVGSKDALMAAAMVIMTDPQGMAKNYIPADPNVIASMKLVQAGQSDSLTFTPAAAGDYPFMCTFPGHSMMMNGVITAQ